MNKTDEVIELYLQEIRNAIHNIVPCETFIEGLRQELQDALKSSGDCTLEELISQFGNPETLAKEFFGRNRRVSAKKDSQVQEETQYYYCRTRCFIDCISRLSVCNTQPEPNKSNRCHYY